MLYVPPNGTMRATKRETLDRHGYVVLEDFLSPLQCDALLAAGWELTENVLDLDQRIPIYSSDVSLQHQIQKHYMESSDKISYFFEEEALGPDGELIVDPSVSLNMVGHALHLQESTFRAFTYCDKVRTLCREMGFKSPAVAQSMYLHKNPGYCYEVVPHQNSAYLRTIPVNPIVVWIALEDATIENGCLWVYRDSHKAGIRGRLIRNPDSASQQLLIFDGPDPVYAASWFTPVPVRKGACILLHNDVVYKSGPNYSNRSRQVYVFNVIETENNIYMPSNALQEGDNAPFVDIYTWT